MLGRDYFIFMRAIEDNFEILAPWARDMMDIFGITESNADKIISYYTDYDNWLDFLKSLPESAVESYDEEYDELLKEMCRQLGFRKNED